MEISSQGSKFLRLLSQAIPKADPKAFSLVASGAFETHLNRFLTSGKMKKAAAEALIESMFVRMVRGAFKEIDPGVHSLVQNIGGFQGNLYSLHLQGDLVVSYQLDITNKLVRLLYIGNHGNHPGYKY